MKPLILVLVLHERNIDGCDVSHALELQFSAQEIVLPITTVVERGLVTEKPKWKEIVNNHQLYSSAHTSVSHFTKGPVLGYVTPVRY